MARITTAERKALPASKFAGPGRSYPDDTVNRARNALARVSQFGSPAVKAEVRAKVHRDYPGIDSDRHPGGYVPNPQMDQPHMHALSMAAATHLQRAGHIGQQQAAAIHARARAAMARSRGIAPPIGAANPGVAPPAAPPPSFGTLSPMFGPGQ